MSLEPGTRVGRYTISRLVAQGGMAEVYRAEQDLAGGISRPVAVKVIRPEYSESEDFRGMFLDEARTACTLSHPNIVHIYEVGETEEGLLYMAMELVPGETLATVNRSLRSHGERLDDEALFAIGILCCSALEAVHALRVEGGTVNLVHRDVSPHNLLLAATGSLKLIDFGIAKAATNRNLTLPGVTKGKAGYFSPEQAMGKTLDGRSDLFSLGVTLYKLASGETPFDDHKGHAERHAALVRGQWKDLDQVYPGLPPGFYEVVRRALQVKPEHRFQTAREMREALEQAAFEAGIRIGQSSLLGYLDGEGEVQPSGGGRASAAPGLPLAPTQASKGAGQVAAVPAPHPQSVRHMAPVPARSPPGPSPVTEVEGPRRRWVLVAAFAGAVALGIAGTAALLQLSSPAAVAPPLPVARVEPQPEAPPTPVVVAPPPRDEPLAAATPDAGAEPEVVPVTEPTPKPVRPRPTGSPRTPPAPMEAPIPEGTGQLRIAVVGAAARLSVQGEDWGDPPVNRKVPSGVYRLVVTLGDGASASTKVSVFPDQTTAVTFDPATQRWATRTQ